jgi:GH15 family glucan-1,4-alpha-glucosidase
VRIGNDASGQRQLDVYGEVVAAAYDYVRWGGHLDPDEARLLRGFGEVVCKQWRQVDQGIWEFRDAGRHYTHSKLMCWVALDRLLRLHEQGHLKVRVDLLRREREAIRNAIEKRGFNRDAGTYVITFDGQDVDASLLLMAHYGYKPANDERLLATFRRIDRELGRNGLLYRYRKGYDDFLPAGENPFVITSFWAVEFLARAGKRELAMERFEQILACANDVGLLAEEVEPDSGALRGNFPQAFSHVGLINAAFSLAELEKGERDDARVSSDQGR